MAGLVSNWRRAWRWHSTQAMAFAAALPFVWIELPADIKAMLPQDWLPYISAVVLIGGIAGRLRDQTPK